MCARLSIERGFDGKYKEEFIPRWVKQEKQKQKPHCCVPGSSTIAERIPVCPLPFILFVWQPELLVLGATATTSFPLYMYTTLCTLTVTLQIITQALKCGGPSDLSPT